jgi:hypothetical protein
MTISTPTFAPSTPCTIHFECLESGPNDSTQVRRLTGILRRARVKIFILAYGSFWLQLPGFSSNLTGHHETKIAKPIWSSRSKYSNFYFEPRLPMTNEDVLNRFRTFRAGIHTGTNVASFRPNEHVMKGGNRELPIFGNFGRGYIFVVSLLFVSWTKTRVLRTRVDLCYHCGPFLACVGEVFKHFLVQTSFLRTYEDIYGYSCTTPSYLFANHIYWIEIGRGAGRVNRAQSRSDLKFIYHDFHNKMFSGDRRAGGQTARQYIPPTQ